MGHKWPQQSRVPPPQALLRHGGGRVCTGPPLALVPSESQEASGLLGVCLLPPLSHALSAHHSRSAKPLCLAPLLEVLQQPPCCSQNETHPSAWMPGPTGSLPPACLAVALSPRPVVPVWGHTPGATPSPASPHGQLPILQTSANVSPLPRGPS